MADKTKAKSTGANFRSADCFYRESDFSRAGLSLIAEREIMRDKSARGLAQSKTLARRTPAPACAKRLGLR
jgi:hypothetical protein